MYCQLQNNALSTKPFITAHTATIFTLTRFTAYETVTQNVVMDTTYGKCVDG